MESCVRAWELVGNNTIYALHPAGGSLTLREGMALMRHTLPSPGLLATCLATPTPTSIVRRAGSVRGLAAPCSHERLDGGPPCRGRAPLRAALVVGKAAVRLLFGDAAVCLLFGAAAGRLGVDVDPCRTLPYFSCEKRGRDMIEGRALVC
jgi:hypothetical protein